MTDAKPMLFGLDELGARRELPARATPERESPPTEPSVFYEDAHVQLWHGRWQDVVPKLGRVDAVITDPPYSERTHSHQRHGRRPEQCNGEYVSARGIGYERWTPAEVAEFVLRMHEVSPAGWFAAMTSHDLCPAYETACARGDRYVFAPLPCVLRGMNVRLAGDGPSSWTVWLVVARPRSLARWGTLPGAYVGLPWEDGENSATASRRSLLVGGKPLWLMRDIVRDYSRAGNVILDPCAGAGTTGRAAKDLGRRAILIEQDRRTCELAAKVLRPARAWQQELGADSDEGVTP